MVIAQITVFDLAEELGGYAKYTSQAIDELFSCDSSSSALARYGRTGFEPSHDDF